MYESARALMNWNPAFQDVFLYYRNRTKNPLGGMEKYYSMRQANREVKDEKEIMNQYHGDEKAYFNPAAISRTSVYCLEVEEITGKRKNPK